MYRYVLRFAELLAGLASPRAATFVFSAVVFLVVFLVGYAIAAPSVSLLFGVEFQFLSPATRIGFAYIFGLGLAVAIYGSFQFFRVFALRSEVSQYGRPNDTNRYRRADIDVLSKRITRLEKLISRSNNLDDLSISTEQKSEMLNKIVAEAGSELSAHAVEAIGDRYFSGKSVDYQEKAVKRLSQNLEALGSRANFNLMFGLFTAFFGIAVLYFAVFLSESPIPTDTGMEGVAAHIFEYLPRLSMVLIVEGVAFFLLRMYAVTLSEIRYVQNEITNIEMKFVSLHSALTCDDQDTVQELCRSFAKTERNFAIDKGKTTIEIETARASSELSGASLRSLLELLDGLKGRNPTQ